MIRLTAGLAMAGMILGQQFQPQIPKVWDENEVHTFELPLAQEEYSPRHLSEKEYYALKVRPIYRTYPVYAPGREPAGYRDWLMQREPEILFDPAKLKTKADWIAAGKLVFEAEPLLSPAPAPGGRPFFPTPLPPDKDGILPAFVPGNVYIIRKKGVIEVGINSCAGCHTRVMPDGSLLPGAQGVVDFPPPPDAAKRVADAKPEALQSRREVLWVLYGTPWILSKEQYFASLSREVLMKVAVARRPGVIARQGTSLTHRPHIPSLIGIEGRKFLDSTGFARHRGIGDLARYAVTNQGLDTMARYGDWQPSAESTAFSGEKGTRYSDEQLYALGLYLYSLQPPTNPNVVDAKAKRGEKVFHAQGCASCHTPPMYTNNKLTLAPGFHPPDDMLKSGDVMNLTVGTDPTLAMSTRRGTGYYKVPSLRGVWYRNAFGHGGWADTLEEWFDPQRLNPDYLPKGYHLEPGPVKGHEFGLRLKADDKAALIAFLKTL
ncbi:MAG: hypothetical protein JNK48_25840 [Bryobacterales bacterium]|nr:hypothetical protein [Bryobacterales bacterium]